MKYRQAVRRVGIAVAAAAIGLTAFGVAFGIEPALIWILRTALAGIGLTMVAIAVLAVVDIFAQDR